MVLENYGQCVNTEFGIFMVGQKIIGNTVADEYEGLTGRITEIRTGDDRDTDNETEDIYVCFEIPDDPELVKRVEADFSASYQEPKTIDEIPLDLVTMAPEMLTALPCTKKVRIYQINPGRECIHNIPVMFMDLEYIKSKFGTLPAHLYDLVFDVDVGTEFPEEIFRIFNVDFPEGYTGRSLSVSDVIELYDETESNFLFCDSYGFKLVTFDSSLCGRWTRKEDI